jgi:hypothetical protein
LDAGGYFGVIPFPKADTIQPPCPILNVGGYFDFEKNSLTKGKARDILIKSRNGKKEKNGTF